MRVYCAAGVLMLILLMTGCYVQTTGNILKTDQGKVSAGLGKEFTGTKSYKCQPLVPVEEAVAIGAAGSLNLLHLIFVKDSATVEDIVDEMQILLMKIRNQFTYPFSGRKMQAVCGSSDFTTHILGRIFYSDGINNGMKISISYNKNNVMTTYTTFREVKEENNKIVLVRENISEEEFDKKSDEYTEMYLNYMRKINEQK